MRAPQRRGRLLGLAIVAAVALGVLGGIGAFTFGYGGGAAYLSDDPAACAQCHVMQEHYDAWRNSGHRHVAECNDCHLSPHPVGKWIVKADNGFFHSLAFTVGGYPDPLQIKPRNRRVTQAACVNCHKDMLEHVLSLGETAEDQPLCVKCHSDVGHALR